MFRTSMSDSEAATVGGFNLKFPPTKNRRGMINFTEKTLVVGGSASTALSGVERETDKGHLTIS